MFRKSEVARLLDEEIAREIRNLSDPQITVKGYQETFDRIVKLTEIRKTERSAPLSKDVVANICGNLFGILAILNHERLHPLPSKALSFVIKPRV